MNGQNSNLKKITQIKRDLFDHEGESSIYFYIVTGAIALLFLIFIMERGGPWGGDLLTILAWVLGFVIILHIAYLLISWTSSVTERPDVWEETREFDTDENLQVKKISTLLDRAAEGKTVSQERLHEKIKDIFFIKLKERKDLNDEEVRDLVRDPDRFRDLVKDDTISDFILSIEENKKGKFKVQDMSEEQYKKKIRKIIRRINEWD